MKPEKNGFDHRMKSSVDFFNKRLDVSVKLPADFRAGIWAKIGEDNPSFLDRLCRLMIGRGKLFAVGATAFVLMALVAVVSITLRNTGTSGIKMAMKTATPKYVPAENNKARNFGQTGGKNGSVNSLASVSHGPDQDNSRLFAGMAKKNDGVQEQTTGHRNIGKPPLISVVSGQAAAGGHHIIKDSGAAPAYNSISSAVLKQTPVPQVKVIYPDIHPGPDVKNTLIHPLSGDRTEFAYNVVVGCDVVIRVYDRNGRPIRNIYSGSKLPGAYAGYWKGDDDTGATVKAGIYILYMRIGSVEKKVTVGVIE
jgi:hypothetical protein